MPSKLIDELKLQSQQHRQMYEEALIDFVRAEALAASRLKLLREINEFVKETRGTCPICGWDEGKCAPDCKLAEELGDD